LIETLERSRRGKRGLSERMFCSGIHTRRDGAVTNKALIFLIQHCHFAGRFVLAYLIIRVESGEIMSGDANH